MSEKRFNENAMGLSQTKAILGIFSVGIILHHVALKTVGSGGVAKVFLPFLGIGFLFVAYFFFCSGYGLYKSYLAKEDYLKGFLGKRIIPLLISFFATDALFQLARLSLASPAFPANTYSWFIFVIVIMYCIFFACFKLFKKNAELAVLGATVLWCIGCRLLFAETYWYNSVLAFPAGLLLAKHEEKITAFVKRRFYLVGVAIIIITGIFIFLSTNDMRLYGIMSAVWNGISFDAVKEVQTVLQCGCAVLFCGVIFIISLKLRLGGKVLTFLGGMTLEIYLVHVLFIELFAEKFIGEGKPLFYIENPFLYLSVVLVLTMPVAFLIKLLRVKVSPLVIGKPYTKYVWKVLRTVFIVIVAVGVVAAVYCSITSHHTSKQKQGQVAEYCNKFITFTKVDGKNISAYIAGDFEEKSDEERTDEEKRTILILGDIDDPAPSLTLRPLADRLAKNYKVIVPDLFGYGFSESTEKPRTSENIAFELHELISELQKNWKPEVALSTGAPVIIMSLGTSGIYAQTYLEKYRSEVEALIGYDMVNSGLVALQYDNPQFTPEQITYTAKMYAKRGALFRRFMNATGFVRMELIMYQPLFSTDVMSDYFDVLEEKFISKSCSKEAVEAKSRLCEEARAVSAFVLPSDLPALFMSLNDNDYLDGESPSDFYHKMLTNEEYQKIVKMAGSFYNIYSSAGIAVEQVEKVFGKEGWEF